MSVSGVAENCARATSANRNDARKAKAICGFMLRRCAPPRFRLRIGGRNSSIAPYPGLGVSPRLLSVALGLPGLGGTHVVRFPEARFRPFRSKASAIAIDLGDDTVLLGERGNRNWKRLKVCCLNALSTIKMRIRRQDAMARK